MVKPALIEAPKSRAQEWMPVPLPQWLIEAPKQRNWIIKNFLPHEAINLLSGQQKWTQKTFFALFLSLLVASGKRYGPLIPGMQGRVLYLLEEGERAETRDRLLAICRGLKIEPPADLLFSHHAQIELDDPEWAARVVEVVKQEKVILTVFDTLTSLKNCDENKSEEMKWVVDALRGTTLAGSSVLAIAHLRKAATDKEDLDHQARGSGVIGQLRDNHVAVRNWKRGKVSDCTLLQRGGPERHYVIRWDLRVDETTDEDGDPVETLRYALPELVQVDGTAYLKKLAAKLTAGTNYKAAELAKALDLPQFAMARLGAEMAREGLIETKGTSFTAL